MNECPRTVSLQLWEVVTHGLCVRREMRPAADLRAGLKLFTIDVTPVSVQHGVEYEIRLFLVLTVELLYRLCSNEAT